MERKGLVLLTGLFLVMGAVVLAFAQSGYLSDFVTTYSASSSPLNTCNLCHTGTPRNASNVNNFGYDYATAGYDFAAIQGLDSDGDGYTNIQEIQAGTFPGDASSVPAVTPPPPGDTVPPTVTSFTIPSAATVLAVSITSCMASDNVAVTGYLLTETSVAPAASATGWSATAPTSYTFASAGAKTLYAWAKDAANNVSAGVSASVTITLADIIPPTVTSFIIPSTATTLAISITSFMASDNVGVTGYLLTETSTSPAASAPGWTVSAPTGYAFTSGGAKTLWAWAKDAAGNVSAGVSGNVTITVTPPPTPSGISVNPTSLGFGDVKVQTSAKKTVNITNGLNKNVRVTGVAINQPEFTSSFSKSREIEPGESYTLTVTFRPAVTGQNNATLDILIDNQSTAAVTVDLSGAGMSDSSNPVAAASPVYRFYNAASGSHFYTISAGERDWIGQNLHVMHDEGVAYYAFTTNEPGTSPVHRFYNTVSGSHFYTISAGERDWIGQNLHVMHDEGVAYYAFTTNEPGTSPVHRFYNTVSGSHFYTVSAGEKDWIAQNLPELHYEGIAYYAQPPASQ
jgi:hypothetical protein